MKEVTPEDLDKWAEEHDLRFKEALNKSIEENSELLKRLGSDYDEHGVPYWDQQIHDQY